MSDHTKTWLRLLNELDESMLEVRKAERDRLLAMNEEDRRREMAAAFARDLVNMP